MAEYEDDYGVEVKGITAVKEDLELDELRLSEEAEETDEHATLYSALASHVIGKFHEFRDARFNSGIENKIVDAQRAYNNEYNPKDLQAIRNNGGSEIFMSITNTKCRAAASWIRDILMNPNVDPFLIEPGSIPDLPAEMNKQIEDSIQEQLSIDAEIKRTATEANPQAPQQPKIKQAEETLRDSNQLRRDVKDAMYEEIRKEGLFQIKQIERLIKDQLEEGDWQKALSDFIDDFVVYPVAIMKGPIVSKNKKLTWVNGEPVISEDEFVFMNKRVSPMDFYPSPNATTIQDGEMLEYLRLEKSDIQDMIGLPYYNDDNIRKVLEGPTSEWINLTNIEDDKADVEKRGTQYEANKHVVHGMHFFGKVQGQDLTDWGASVEKFNEVDYDPIMEYEVEIILAGNEVIKCQINDDPYHRRPYYSASYCSIPGSFWGRSLPDLITDVQRMCNATARSLSNNMAISSGPLLEINIDRLADKGDISTVTPFKIYQTTTDPSGGNQRALNFFDVPSHAAELLGVYRDFEQKADDASGIPKYAHGNQDAKGAASTAAGLSMMLENASKSIKDSIRNIDFGLIIPRIEYQFYYNLLKNPQLKYTGDVNVVAIGSSALTVKGSQQLRRNEFLAATANPTDMAVLGIEGRAEILRVMGEDLGLGKNIIPDNLELKRKIKEDEERQQQAAEAQGSEKQVGLQATQIQVEGQMKMHENTQMVKQMELQMKATVEELKNQMKMMQMQHEKEMESFRQSASIEGLKLKEANANARKRAELESV